MISKQVTISDTRLGGPAEPLAGEVVVEILDGEDRTFRSFQTGADDAELQLLVQAIELVAAALATKEEPNDYLFDSMGRYRPENFNNKEEKK